MLRLVAISKDVATFLFFALVVFLPSCTARLFPYKYAQELAAEANWQERLIKGSDFDVVSFAPRIAKADILTIYIEGDGESWGDRFNPSPDPTPTNPIALRMALADKNSSAIYLARPCQYLGRKHPNCSPYYWTNGRFSPEVTRAFNAALDKLKTEYQAKSLRLVGYSGGGVLAAILAGQRNDVSLLVSFAAPLDMDSWVNLHEYSHLTGSEYPLLYRDKLAQIPQIHFTGGKDKNVPPKIISSYINKLAPKVTHNNNIIEYADHECCWIELLSSGKVSY